MCFNCRDDLFLLFIEYYGKIKKYVNMLLCLVYIYIEVFF